LWSAINAGAALKETVAFFGNDFNCAERSFALFKSEEKGVNWFENSEVVELCVFLHECGFGGTAVAAKTLTETHRVVGFGLFLHFFRDVGEDELDGMTLSVIEVGETWGCKGCRDIGGKTFGREILEKLVRLGRVV
jgi:hypothetical protein